MKLLSAVRRKTGADRPLIHIIPRNEDRPHDHAGVHRIKKAPDHKTRGARIQSRILFFSHPDCNCRYRNSPDMPSVILLQTHSRSGRSRVTDSFTKWWSRTLPPVGTFIPPRRIPVFTCEIYSVQLHTTYYISLLPIVNTLTRLLPGDHVTSITPRRSCRDARGAKHLPNCAAALSAISSEPFAVLRDISQSSIILPLKNTEILIKQL